MRFLIFTILIFAYTFQVKAEDSAVICEQEFDGVVLDKPELLKLFREIKNEVLGSVPKFCRAGNTTEQLKEQVAAEEDELSKFVKALKDSKDLGNDQVIFKGEEKISEDSLIFQNLKMLVLKKMWNNSSEEQQVKILLSKECYALKLNKYPVNGKNSKKISDEEKNLASKNNLAVCGATAFSQIAPYLTNDILAEGLANLKTIAPNNFNSLVDNLCQSLKETDELIFKEDIYLKMGMSEKDSDGSSKKFSAWLKLLLKDDIKAKKEARIQQEAYKKSVKEAKAKLQQQYAEIYEKAQTPEAQITEVPNGPMVIIKKDGKYYQTYSSEVWAQKKTHADQYAAQATDYAVQGVKTQIAFQKKKMLEAYNAAQVQGEEEKPVPVQGAPGYFLVKGPDGSVFYSIDKKAQNEINEKLQAYLADSAAKKSKQEKLEYIQEGYQQDYEQQQGMPEWKLKAQESKIVLKADGTYESVPVKKENDPKSAYVSELILNGVNVPVPFFGWYGEPASEGIINDNGVYKPVVFSSLLKKNKEVTEEESNSPGRTFNLTGHIDSNYQKRNYDPAKKTYLSPQEKEAIGFYTGSGYHGMNSCLRSDSCEGYNQQAVTNVVSGMKKIKKDTEDGSAFVVYRGTRLPEDILEKLKTEPKKFVLDKGFMSTSGNISTSYSFSGTSWGQKVTGNSALFIIKSKNCVGVSNLSSMPSEDEFLCPPGMKFNVKRQDPDSNVFILEDQD